MISVSVKKFGLPGVLTLYLEYFYTVKSVKEGIYVDKNMKVPPNQQQLFFNERPLDDSLTLSQCGIENGSQIVVRDIKFNATCTVCNQVMSVSMHAFIDHCKGLGGGGGSHPPSVNLLCTVLYYNNIIHNTRDHYTHPFHPPTTTGTTTPLIMQYYVQTNGSPMAFLYYIICSSCPVLSAAHE